LILQSPSNSSSAPAINSGSESADVEAATEIDINPGEHLNIILTNQTIEAEGAKI